MLVMSLAVGIELVHIGSNVRPLVVDIGMPGMPSQGAHGSTE